MSPSLARIRDSGQQDKGPIQRVASRREPAATGQEFRRQLPLPGSRAAVRLGHPAASSGTDQEHPPLTRMSPAWPPPGRNSRRQRRRQSWRSSDRCPIWIPRRSIAGNYTSDTFQVKAQKGDRKIELRISKPRVRSGLHLEAEFPVFLSRTGRSRRSRGRPATQADRFRDRRLQGVAGEAPEEKVDAVRNVDRGHGSCHKAFPQARRHPLRDLAKTVRPGAEHLTRGRRRRRRH